MEDRIIRIRDKYLQLKYRDISQIFPAPLVTVSLDSCQYTPLVIIQSLILVSLRNAKLWGFHFVSRVSAKSTFQKSVMTDSDTVFSRMQWSLKHTGEGSFPAACRVPLRLSQSCAVLPSVLEATDAAGWQLIVVSIELSQLSAAWVSDDLVKATTVPMIARQRCLD